MSYDSRCYDLACVFLTDTPSLDNETKRKALAQSIQKEIEDWIEWEIWNERRVQESQKPEIGTS